MNQSIWIETDRLINESKFDEAVSWLEKKIVDSAIDEFQPLVSTGITNPPEELTESINNFVTQSNKSFPVKSVYLEMNGFDINYDRWYLDYFAYDSFLQSSDDYEWLCDWKSEEWPETTILGLEQCQKVFEWYHENRVWKHRSEVKETYEAAMLLIMSKFINYIAKALGSGKVSVPVLATAHGFESIACIKP